MADQQEDYSSLPLTDRFVHKIWKVRKEAYEEAAKKFALTPDESDPVFRPFLNDAALWKNAAADSNVAAQQEGIASLCAFLKYGGRDACLRTRNYAVTAIVEKCLSSSRAATKQNAIEALLLYIELDVSGPIIEDVLTGLSNKVPKNVAATINAISQIVHNYGCRVVDPKPILKALPKAFGAADKNVRAEATNLTVELYRWLREAMKPLFWGELKPTQQSDLEAQFEKIKSEAPPQQERLLRSQQAAAESAPAGGEGDEEGDEEGQDGGEWDAFALAEPQDVLKKIPPNFSELLASSKWKDRKEAVDALFAALDVPRIKDSDFSEVSRGLAKCMKDANVAVVIQAAMCVESLAKGLREGFSKYRSTVMQPIMDRLKEKKTTVAEALAAALDGVFGATSLTDCFDDITLYLGNKNPQVKEGTMKFLIRCLRTTKTVPSKPEIASLCDSGKKLLSESSPVLRDGGAEILGTVMKIIGERAMTPHMDSLDDIRKTKVKEFFATAEVKAKEKPKAAPTPKAAPGGPKKLVGGKRPVAKKPAAAAPAAYELPPTPSAAAPSRAAGPGSKLGMPKPSGLGLKAPQKRVIGGGAAAPPSPRRPNAAPPIMPTDEEQPAAPPQRQGVSRGPAGRLLAKPVAAPAAMPPASPPPVSGLTAEERRELEEVRGLNDRLLGQLESMKQEKSKYLFEIQELKNQNAGLIEDHTRDMLSIKAKETQLVRARSDVEATEQTNDRLRRELERLKRALSRAEGLGGSGSGVVSPIMSPTHEDAGIYNDSGSASAGRNRTSFASTLSEEKENGEMAYPRSKLSSDMRYGSGSASPGRGSPARGYRTGSALQRDEYHEPTSGITRERPTSSLPQPSGSNGGESWRRAAEVTSQLKARIEQMKAKQGFARP